MAKNQLEETLVAIRNKKIVYNNELKELEKEEAKILKELGISVTEKYTINRYDKTDNVEDELDLHKHFTDWDHLIVYLRDAERKLINLKEKRDEETQKILWEFDFKKAYGKNNETIRKNHIKKELSPIYDEIKELKLDIADTKRRINFLKSIITMKIELIGVIK